MPVTAAAIVSTTEMYVYEAVAIYTDDVLRIRLDSFAEFVDNYEVRTSTGVRDWPRLTAEYSGFLPWGCPRRLHWTSLSPLASHIIYEKASRGSRGASSVYQLATHFSCPSMNDVIDTLILYTVETGFITWYVVSQSGVSADDHLVLSAATIASLITVRVDVSLAVH